MAKYRCKICGYIYDNAKEKIKFEELPDDWTCPMCGAPKHLFELLEEQVSIEEEKEEISLQEYLKSWERQEDDREIYMKELHEMAIHGKSIITAMGTKTALSPWEDILILGAQLNPRPLPDHEEVTLTTILGKHAKKPLKLESPVYISHMSFGALSREVKLAFAKAATENHTATCSGEGGILEEEIAAAEHYIFEFVPNRYSVTDENLKRVGAIEIKIGQGTKPGMGGHLPGEKVTEEIARIRNKPVGEDIISPSRFEEIVTKEDLKNLVEELRNRSEGRPIGVKIAAGHIEQDLEFITYAQPDFITIDGRGGGTGASPKVVRDATTVPTLYALTRARKYLDEHHYDIDLVITGGFRLSSEMAKALALGADAVAIATSVMIASGCQQYRICGSGKCPLGIATQDPELRKRLKVDLCTKRVSNYLRVVNEELKTFGRITGHKNIHDLNSNDLVTVNSEVSNHTNIKHV